MKKTNWKEWLGNFGCFLAIMFSFFMIIPFDPFAGIGFIIVGVYVLGEN